MEKFSYEANGYNRSEVNNFVNDVIKETEGIIVRVKKQNAELEALRNEIKKYRDDNTLNNSIIKQKEVEAQMIIDNAKANASRIVNEALLRAQEKEQEKQILEMNIRMLKKKLKAIMQEQQAIVDEIEILEMEEN